MSSSTFSPAEHLIKVKGGSEYLEVRWRLVWFRSDHPEGIIDTALVEFDDRHAIFKATVSIPSGGSSTGYGSETPGDFGDYLEKAETKALGRALAALGYGTQFCDDYAMNNPDGTPHVVDAPVKRSAKSASKAAPKTSGDTYPCETEGCTGVVKPFGKYSLEDAIAFSNRAFGKALCRDCYTKAKAGAA